MPRQQNIVRVCSYASCLATSVLSGWLCHIFSPHPFVLFENHKPLLGRQHFPAQPLIKRLMCLFKPLNNCECDLSPAPSHVMKGILGRPSSRSVLIKNNYYQAVLTRVVRESGGFLGSSNSGHRMDSFSILCASSETCQHGIPPLMCCCSRFWLRPYVGGWLSSRSR